MSKKPSRKLEIIQRRRKVAELTLKSWTQSAIADHLNVRQSTVSDDLKKIRQDWQNSSIRDFDAMRDVEVRKIELIALEAWAGYQRSCQPHKSSSIDGQAGSQKSRNSMRTQNGDPRFLDTLLKCREATRELLGLNAPLKVAPTDVDGQPLTNEQRTLHINSIVAEYADSNPTDTVGLIPEGLSNAEN